MSGKAIVHAQIGIDLQYAAELLVADELVGIPTETVYGLAGNALSASAVAKIFEVKARPHFDPLIVHVQSRAKLQELVVSIPSWAHALAEAFWPGPLTLILKKKSIIPDIVTAGLDTVAVRVPSHPLTLELLGDLSFPLAAPSANPYGYVSPTSVHHVIDQLGDQIGYVVDGGTCTVGLESTIVGEQGGRPMIYRLGGISVEEISAIIGDVGVRMEPHDASGDALISPGTASSHYAPLTPMIIGDPDFESYDLNRVATLRYREPFAGVPLRQQIILSKSGNLREAAAQLFAAMRELDGMNVEAIFAEPMPAFGLGRAMNDRLQRASTNRSV